MGKWQNKNKSKNKVNPSSVVDNEYDLERNIKKINSYSKNRRYREKSQDYITDSGENEELCSQGSGFIETPHATSMPLRTGDHAAWESYTRLDDKITDFNYKNDQAHTALRKELEAKIKDSIAPVVDSIKECKDDISKCLSVQWYIWTIIGLVAIVGIWYMFSYINVHPLPGQVQEMDKRLNSIERKIDMIQSDTTRSGVKRLN